MTCKKIKLVIKNILTEKTLGLSGLIYQSIYHWWFISNISRRNNTIPSQALPENVTAENTSQIIV